MDCTLWSIQFHYFFYDQVNNHGSSIAIYDNRIVILYPQVYVRGSQIVVHTIALEFFMKKCLIMDHDLSSMLMK